jgi:hypothetical protein
MVHPIAHRQRLVNTILARLRERPVRLALIASALLLVLSWLGAHRLSAEPRALLLAAGVAVLLYLIMKMPSASESLPPDQPG